MSSLLSASYKVLKSWQRPRAKASCYSRNGQLQSGLHNYCDYWLAHLFYSPRAKAVLSLMHAYTPHLPHKNMQFLAARVSGKLPIHKAVMDTLKMSCVRPGDPRHRNGTRHIYSAGKYSALNEKKSLLCLCKVSIGISDDTFWSWYLVQCYKHCSQCDFNCGNDGKGMGRDPRVISFMKSVFELRTPLPKSKQTWDAGILLKHFHKNRSQTTN